jgi:Alginate export
MWLLSLEYNYASGNAAKDGEPNTFDQFYPSNHNYYGMIDQFGWKNMKNERAGFDFLPLKKLKVRTDFNEFYLATVQDGLYNSTDFRGLGSESNQRAHRIRDQHGGTLPVFEGLEVRSRLRAIVRRRIS